MQELHSSGPPSYLHTTVKPCSPQQFQSSLNLFLLTPQHLVRGGGGGGLWDTDWMYVNWALNNPALYPLYINYKETFTIVLAAGHWAPFWSGYFLVVKSDSQVATAILNKGSSCCPMMMTWIRYLLWLKEYFSFSLFVEHIPGSINTLADNVSRLDEARHWPEFQAWLSKSPTSRDLKSHMSASLALLRSKG